jgi:hypothetical protein
MHRQPTAIHDEGLITETLDTIAAERGNLDRSFDLVDDIIRKFGESGLAERLYEAVPQTRPWQDLSDLFGILIWSTSDNGDQLMRAMERWLVSAGDVRQISIALSVGVYPFKDQSKMEQILARVARVQPATAQLCSEVIASRRSSPEAGA